MMNDTSSIFNQASSRRGDSSHQTTHHHLYSLHASSTSSSSFNHGAATIGPQSDSLDPFLPPFQPSPDAQEATAWDFILDNAAADQLFDYDLDELGGASSQELSFQQNDTTRLGSSLPEHNVHAQHRHGQNPVDLTYSPSPQADMSSNNLKRSGPSGSVSHTGPAPKRRRLSNSSSASQDAPPRKITQIDLSQDDAVQSVHQKQLADQIISQEAKNANTKRKSRLTSLQCNVCLEAPTDLTATVCGMFWKKALLCHSLPLLPRRTALSVNNHIY